MEKYSRKYCILMTNFGLRFLPKYSHLTYEITSFSWDVNFFSDKKTKLPLLSLTATTNSYPPPLNPCLPLPWAVDPPPFAKGIFENVQNILGNLIHILNALKNTCLKKLFSRIVFPKILFPRVKIQTSYQRPLRL